MNWLLSLSVLLTYVGLAMVWPPWSTIAIGVVLWWFTRVKLRE